MVKFRDYKHGFQTVDLAGVYAIVLVGAIEQTSEVDSLEIEAVYLLWTLCRTPYTYDDEHWIPGLIHRTLVMA